MVYSEFSNNFPKARMQLFVVGILLFLSSIYDVGGNLEIFGLTFVDFNFDYVKHVMFLFWILSFLNCYLMFDREYYNINVIRQQYKQLEDSFEIEKSGLAATLRSIYYEIATYLNGKEILVEYIAKVEKKIESLSPSIIEYIEVINRDTPKKRELMENLTKFELDVEKNLYFSNRMQLYANQWIDQAEELGNRIEKAIEILEKQNLGESISIKFAGKERVRRVYIDLILPLVMGIAAIFQYLRSIYDLEKWIY